jgi:rhodanese-related sulfurtransferase
MRVELEITVTEAANRINDDVVVLDVREDHERAESYIAPSIHIPLGDLSLRAGELPTDRPLLVYCHSGVRSAMAVDALRAAGYEATNVGGGIAAWEAAGLPVTSGS